MSTSHKLDGTPQKFSSDKIYISLVSRLKKNTLKRKMYDSIYVKDKFLFMGIQDLSQLSTLNAIYVDVGRSPTFLEFVNRHSPNKHMYRFRILLVTISTSTTNMKNDILVTCTGLNNCKKGHLNGKQEDILAIIHIENISNWNRLKSTSSWVNIDLTDYLEIQSAGNISFNFIASSIYDISKFVITFKNGKGEAIIFNKKEKKIYK